jgi:hypothetical protein
MQRWIPILVASVSLISIDGQVTAAQSTSAQPATPTTAAQRSEGPAGTPQVTIEGRHEGALPATCDLPLPSGLDGDRTIAAGQTVDNVALRHGHLDLAGHVTHDVLAVESQVTIRPGATVGGSLVAIGGSVDNRAGDAVRVIRQDAAVASALEPVAPAAPARPVAPAAPVATVQPAKPAPTAHAAARPEHKSHSWFGGQIALLTLGLIAGLTLLTIAPNATRAVADAVAPNPARCLAVGGIATLGLLFVQIFNSGLIRWLGTLWAPFGVAIVLCAAALLLSGWICGLRVVGDAVARRLGRPLGRAHHLAAAGVGLAAFFVLNCLLGAISVRLVPLGLLAEMLVTVIGFGAICMTGFGSDPDWLTKRLQGETRWFGASHPRW